MEECSLALLSVQVSLNTMVSGEESVSQPPFASDTADDAQPGTAPATWPAIPSGSLNTKKPTTNQKVCSVCVCAGGEGRVCGCGDVASEMFLPSLPEWLDQSEEGFIIL